jgi:hypothetical protein
MVISARKEMLLRNACAIQSDLNKARTMHVFAESMLQQNICNRIGCAPKIFDISFSGNVSVREETHEFP